MEVSSLYNEGIIKLSMLYSKQYEVNPNNFITCFKKFKSIRSCCDAIVNVYKRIGAYDDCKKSGKDFTEWVNKQNVKDKILLLESIFTAPNLAGG